MPFADNFERFLVDTALPPGGELVHGELGDMEAVVVVEIVADLLWREGVLVAGCLGGITDGDQVEEFPVGRQLEDLGDLVPL